MAGVKITDLDSATGVPDNGDILIIVDKDTNVTKQIKAGDLLLGQTANQSNQVLLSTSSNSSNKVFFGDGSNGQYDSVNISNDLTFDASSGTLSATVFAGSGANLTNLPSNEPVVNAVDAGIDDDGYHVMIRKAATGNDSVQTASNLLFNPNSGVFSSPFFSGDGGQLTNLLADSALHADHADSATFAVNATNAINADSATNATSALVSDRALVADSATVAASALFAANANVATIALNAVQSNNSTFADSADHTAFALEAQRAERLILASMTNETKVFPILSLTKTGVQYPRTDSAISYNVQTGLFTAPQFVGDGSLLTNLPLTASGVVATAVNVVSTATNATHSILMTQSATGVDSVNSDPDFTYNPSTNLLSVLNISGNGSLMTEVPAVSITSKTGPTSGTQYLLMKPNQTGNDSVSTDAGAVWDAATDTMTFTNVSGNGSGLSNVAAITATNATNIDITTVDSAGTYYLHFGSSASGNDNVNVDLDLTYNPDTNVIGANNLYTTSAASLWYGSAPTTTTDAINRLATLVKSLNSGTGA